LVSINASIKIVPFKSVADTENEIKVLLPEFALWKGALKWSVMRTGFKWLRTEFSGAVF
jgi:hypothetical protein